MDRGEASFDDVYEKAASWVPDVSFDAFSYMERNCKFGDPKFSTINLYFKRFTISTGKWKKMVQDGSYPMKDVNILLESIKAALEDIPDDIRQRFRPSCMILDKTDPEIMDDGAMVFALKRKYMLFMKDTVKNWILKDLSYQKKGGPR